MGNNETTEEPKTGAKNYLTEQKFEDIHIIICHIINYPNSLWRKKKKREMHRLILKNLTKQLENINLSPENIDVKTMK